MKNFIAKALVLAVAAATVFSSCKKNGGQSPDTDPDNIPSSDVTFSVSGVTSGSASVSIAVKDGKNIYVGVKLMLPLESREGLDKLFYDDAEPVIGGYVRQVWDESKEDFVDEFVYGEGLYGVKYGAGGFNGDLGKLAVHDNGDGKRESRILIPGATYAVGILPYAEGEDYKNLSAKDVKVEFVTLSNPSYISTAMCNVSEGTITTTSVEALFSLTENVSRMFYSLSTEKELQESGLSNVDFALYKGAVWDREANRTSGPVQGLDALVTMLAPGQACVATALAINKSGQCYSVSTVLHAKNVEKTSGTLTLLSMDNAPYNESTTVSEITVTYEASSEIVKIRYKENPDVASDNEAYTLLTTGARWDYTEISSTEEIRYTVSSEEVNAQKVYAVGVDADGKFTDLQKIESK